MKVDLHVHINRASRCARQEPEEAAKEAVKQGIDAIAMLDHHYYPTANDLEKARQAAPELIILRAMEITVQGNGGSNDIVLVCPKCPPNIGFHKDKVPESQLPEIGKFLQKNGGFSILAHPFRKHKPIYVDICECTPDCIEIASRSTPLERRNNIAEIALLHKMVCVSSSDAHKTYHIGKYCIEFDGGNELKKAILKSVTPAEIVMADLIKKRQFNLLEKRLAPVENFPRNPKAS